MELGRRWGDPLEIESLSAVYGIGRSKSRPLLVGSIKPNIGHLEYAAGLAGLLKVVVALKNDRIPSHLLAGRLNSRISWDELAISVIRTSKEWPRGKIARRAGVSAFGISGTNVHVILEEAPEVRQPGVAAWPFVLSAESEETLKGQAEQLREHVLAHQDLGLVDLAYSLATTRTRFEHRATIVADSREGLLSALDALAQGRPAPGAVLGRARGEGKMAFLFTGQGSQRPAMGRTLYDRFPIFREA